MTQQNAQTDGTRASLTALGFSEPTPIQSKAIPVLASGKSLYALAPTGSGKTLAFLIPLFRKIDLTTAATQLLILVPTRELGKQVAQVADQLTRSTTKSGDRQITTRCAFGGHRIEAQKVEIEKKPHVLVATPGRALDLMRRDILSLDALVAFVLDEADLMLGMGFEQQIVEVCDYLPNGVQTALFSATDTELETRLQNRLSHRSVRVDVHSEETGEAVFSGEANARDRHEYLFVENHIGKNKALIEFLRHNDASIASGVVFCQTRAGAAEVCQHLRANGFAAEELSGGLGQIERSTIMRRFKARGMKYLVATNIAARGIDIDSLSIVINYDLPSTSIEYTHRSGRSGRAGATGWTLSLCLRGAQKFYFDVLSKINIKPQMHEMHSPEQAAAPAIQKTNSKPVRFSKIYLNRGKSDKVRPGDIMGVLGKQLGMERDDVGNIFIFEHFSHVEINEDKVADTLELLSNIKIKNLSVKASEARELSAPKQRPTKRR